MIGALILAAGQSKRFGKPKLSEPLKNGSTLIEEVLRKTEGIFDDRLVITRSPLNKLITRLERYDVPFLCIDDSTGLGDSIAYGVQQISNEFHEKWDACVICLADMPFIQSNTYQSVYNTLKNSKTNSSLVVPCIKNNADRLIWDEVKRGHPVGFGRDYFHTLSHLTGDVGAQKILKENSDNLSLLAVDDHGIFIDIDSQADLVRLQP